VTNVKVVTEPTIMALNHSPTVLYDGRQIPYLGSVTSNVTGTTGTVSTSGSLSYATDGISLGVRPNIIDSSKVELSLIPMISTVNGFSEFQVSGNTLKAPNQPIQQTHLQVLAENGKTMIIGGIRSGQEQLDNTGVPGLAGNSVGKFLGGRSSNGAHKEMVIMIHTNILPAPKYNALVGESI
jgi:MSHA biogenesis protein MshL